MSSLSIRFEHLSIILRICRSNLNVYQYVFIHIIYLFVFAFFSNTPHVFFQVAAFYQIWQACVFHDTSPQPSDLWNPIDISPLCSPTFLVFKENLFNKYNIPYFTEINLLLY